jgi:hypothetical protein
MKRIGTAGILALALTIGGCSAQQGHQNQSQAASVAPIESDAAPEAEATPKPITGAELLAQRPAEIRAAFKGHDQNGKWATYKSPQYVLYPFNQGPNPVVDCEPLRTTDLQLQAGETITDVAMGDTERWMATPASSGDPTNPTPHLAVKPQAPAIVTNLTIYTTKHIYQQSRVKHCCSAQRIGVDFINDPQDPAYFQRRSPGPSAFANRPHSRRFRSFLRAVRNQADWMVERSEFELADDFVSGQEAIFNRH